MKWKDLKLSKKFTVGFGSLIFLIGVVAIWSIWGINGIVGNAEQVIEGNKLKAVMVQKEVDHLNWAQHVTKLFTDETVTQLDVETDSHKCAFGQWYHGEDRQKAEALIPELKPLLASLEEPHQKLHESAKQIGSEFVQADFQTGNFLREKKTDHLAWANKVKDVFVDSSLDFIEAETDPHKCGLGQWMYSNQTQQLRGQDKEFDSLLTALEIPHNKLHQSAEHIQSLLDQKNREEARSYYMAVTKPTAYNCLKRIDDVLVWHNNKVNQMHKAEMIFAKTTQPMLQEMQSGLHNIIASVNDNIMTDQEMLTAAAATRQAVIIISLIAAAIGVFLAYVIARGIISPLLKGVNFAQLVSDGDLTQQIDLHQEDEIGILAKSLNEMSANLQQVMAGIQQASEQVASSSEELSASSQNLANGATEQASNLEETSAAIEELASSVEQNANNATTTNQVTQQAAQDAESGGEVVMETVDDMKKIAEQISIIEDIADQTNLLALNAAIEAARAGEMGKGFAVVAVEVRKLAERSQTAAKEITELSKNSVIRAEEAGKRIQNVVPKIQEASHLVQEIAESCSEQSRGSSQIRDTIAQLDQVTQQNSSSSEELAASSEELSAQALSMQDMVSRFKVGEVRKLMESVKQKSYSIRHTETGENFDEFTKGSTPVNRLENESTNVSTNQEHEFTHF